MLELDNLIMSRALLAYDIFFSLSALSCLVLSYSSWKGGGEVSHRAGGNVVAWNGRMTKGTKNEVREPQQL